MTIKAKIVHLNLNVMFGKQAEDPCSVEENVLPC